jgi:spermidine synthase
MLAWELLDEARIPESGESLRLKRRGCEYSIMLGSNELMNSRLSGSEEALATLALAALSGRPAPNLLIGGLGMGFTLRAALATADATARITVVELVAEVVAWARGPMAELHAGTLHDERVTIVESDVGVVIRAGERTYDAILLDVDNGPDGLSRPGNDALYGARGLGEARRALTPGGVLAVWSAHPAPRFTQRLRQAGFEVTEKPVRARGKSGARHTIWLARRPV